MFGSFFNAPGRARERGFAMISMALMLLFILIPAAGLAIDVGMMYLVQSRLSGAVDAAALAGARALSRGSDDPTQRANAEQMANAYFHANYPSSYFYSTNVQVTSHATTDSAFVRSVTTTASVDLPLLFMRIFSRNISTINASATATRRDANVMLVLDRSTSLATSGSCGPMKAAAAAFVEKFTENRDNLGLVTFATGSNIDDPPRQTFKTSVTTHISQISCNGYTNSAQGLWDAYTALVNLGQGGALNVIVFFTDGLPTAVTADFPIKSSSSCNNKADKTGVLHSGLQGLYDYVRPLGSSDRLITNSSGCAFASNPRNVDDDVKWAPLTDHWRNSMTATNYRTPSTSGSGLSISSSSNVEKFATNAADDAGYRIRRGETIASGDSLPNVVIFTIGYGSDVDATLLKRIANDPSMASSNVAAGQQGLYVFAPTMADLDQAFTRIASEILRLAQ